MDVTTRSRLTLIALIRKLINNNARGVLFRETCFSSWLDLEVVRENAILVYYFICHQLECREGGMDIVPLTYMVRGIDLQVGREEFCLITGLRFGTQFVSSFEVGVMSLC